MNRRDLFVAVLVLAAFTMGAVSANPLIPLVNGRGVAAETNNSFATGYSTVMVPIAWVSNDSNVNETTEVLLDTGTEACAAVAMDCALTYTIEPDGADDSDDLVPSTCGTDLDDTVKALSFCY